MFKICNCIRQFSTIVLGYVESPHWCLLHTNCVFLYMFVGHLAAPARANHLVEFQGLGRFGRRKRLAHARMCQNL